MMTEISLFPSPPKRRGMRSLEALRDWLALRRRRRDMARSLRGLDRLDDRLLDDIGLTRDDVGRIRAPRASLIMARISGRPFRPDGI